MKTIFAAASAILALASAPALATTTVVTGSYTGADTDGWRYDSYQSIGTTFTVPALDFNLTQFTFYIDTFYIDAFQTPQTETYTFKAYVMAWSTGLGRPTGSVLWESGTINFSSPSETDIPVTVSTGGLNLSPGGTYAAFFSLSPFTSLVTRGEMGWNGTNSYAGGTMIWGDTGNGTGTANFTNGVWLAFSSDIVGSLVFESAAEVPEPAAPLAASGLLLALHGLWRRGNRRG